MGLPETPTSSAVRQPQDHRNSAGSHTSATSSHLAYSDPRQPSLDHAEVAQWQSNRLVSDRSRVQSPPSARAEVVCSLPLGSFALGRHVAPGPSPGPRAKGLRPLKPWARQAGPGSASRHRHRATPSCLYLLLASSSLPVPGSAPPRHAAASAARIRTGSWVRGRIRTSYAARIRLRGRTSGPGRARHVPGHRGGAGGHQPRRRHRPVGHFLGDRAVRDDIWTGDFISRPDTVARGIGRRKASAGRTMPSVLNRG